MENKDTNWLAIASFILAIVWLFLCMTFIFGFLWIFCIILSLIFWIIALCKKQTLWAALTGTIISWIITLFSTVLIIIVSSFIYKHSDQLIDPISNFATWAQENPQYESLLNNEEVKEQFQTLLQERLESKYGKNFDDVNDVNWILSVWASLFEEMPSILLELSENNWSLEIWNNIETDFWNEINNEKDNEELNILNEDISE